MNQATRRNLPPFLTTTRTLNNVERLCVWERRKREQADLKADDQIYLGVWFWVIVIIGLAIAIGQLFMPCLVVWTSAGVQCW